MDASFAAYAWSNDRRIATLTGQVFSQDYRDRVLGDPAGRLDSAPATLALTAVAVTTPAREMDALGAIQRARYVDGRDTTDVAVLVGVLDGLDLTRAAERLSAPDEMLLDAVRGRLEAGRAMMRDVSANGVPTLVVKDAGARRAVNAGSLLGDFDELLADLRTG